MRSIVAALVFGSTIARAGAAIVLPHVDVGYVNRSSKVAKLVDFALVGQAMFVRTVRDTGTISPNAPIQKSFPLTEIEDHRGNSSQG